MQVMEFISLYCLCAKPFCFYCVGLVLKIVILRASTNYTSRWDILVMLLLGKMYS